MSWVQNTLTPAETILGPEAFLAGRQVSASADVEQSKSVKYRARLETISSQNGRTAFRTKGNSQTNSAVPSRFLQVLAHFRAGDAVVELYALLISKIGVNEW
jgi:hypothetical protein